MQKFVVVVFVQIFLAANLWPQQQLSVTRRMPAVQTGRTVNKTVFLPLSLENTLTKLLLTTGHKPDCVSSECAIVAQLADFSLLRVSQYFDSRSSTDRHGITTVNILSHPAFYPAVSYRNKLYVFSEREVRENTDIFNRFLKDANLSFGNRQEIKQIVNLYLAATRGYFEDNGKLILSHVDDIPIYYRRIHEAEAARLSTIIEPPKIEVIGDQFNVRLNTWETASGDVKTWNFSIRPNSALEVSIQMVGKL